MFCGQAAVAWFEQANGDNAMTLLSPVIYVSDQFANILYIKREQKETHTDGGRMETHYRL